MTSGNGQFAEFGEMPCDAAHHLYCFGIDRVVVLGEPPPPPQPSHLAFVSRGAFAASTTRPVADAMCASEAAEAGLAGDFLAALPLLGESTASRFTSNVYFRTDGVRLGRILSDTVPAAFLNCPNARVYVTDGNQFFNRPGPRLVESLEIMAACVHPDLFTDLATKHEAVITRLV